MFLAGLAAAPARAETWISPGGSLSAEMDMTSIIRRGTAVSVRMRLSGRTEQGLLTSYLDMAAVCGGGFLYVLDSEVRASWSSRVAPMPDVPAEDRVILLPVPNPAFQNLYDYACRF